jgi:hypothetical protein
MTSSNDLPVEICFIILDWLVELNSESYREWCAGIDSARTYIRDYDALSQTSRQWMQCLGDDFWKKRCSDFGHRMYRCKPIVDPTHEVLSNVPRAVTDTGFGSVRRYYLSILTVSTLAATRCRNFTAYNSRSIWVVL